MRRSVQVGSAHGKPDEKPVHEVTISKPFCVGDFEVTVEQWERVMGDGEIPAERNDQLRPKTSITWEQAEQFVERLNAQNPGRHFFLLTEAQWEYAARAGSAARFSFGDDLAELHRYANCQSHEGHEGGFNGPASAAKLSPNRWNLYDMQGNVAEWVADFAGSYDSGPVVDPTGPPAGDRHVYRGGSWKSTAESCSVAHRASLRSDTRRKDLGFRIAAEPVH